MAKSSGQKLKLLYLIKMLQENTDENHPMSTPDIIKYLENQGIHAERKSIYSDMESLADFGYDGVQVQSRLGGGYYLGSWSRSPGKTMPASYSVRSMLQAGSRRRMRASIIISMPFIVPFRRTGRSPSYIWTGTCKRNWCPDPVGISASAPGP